MNKVTKLVKHKLSTIVYCLLIIIGYLSVGCDNYQPKSVVPKWKPLEIFNSCNKVAIGGSQVLVATDAGELYAWGFNYTFTLGNPSMRRVLFPVKITTIDNVKCVAAGNKHSVVVKKDGSVWQWGTFVKASGRSSGKQKVVVKSPQKVNNITDATGVSADENYTLVTSASKGVFSWGSNNEGQLGHGHVSYYEEPKVIENSKSFVFVEAGSGKSYAIDHSGHLWEWGGKVVNNNGRLSRVWIPAPVKNDFIVNAVKVSDVKGHRSLLTDSGHVLVWGFNIHGALGTNNDGQHLSIPTAIAYDGLAVDINGRQLLSDNREIWRWGLQYYYVGDGRITRYPYKNTPTKLHDDSAGQQIFTGGGSRGVVGISIDDNGCLESWGYSSSGQRGDGSRNFQKLFFNNKRVKIKYKTSAFDGDFLCIQKEMNNE